MSLTSRASAAADPERPYDRNRQVGVLLHEGWSSTVQHVTRVFWSSVQVGLSEGGVCLEVTASHAYTEDLRLELLGVGLHKLRQHGKLLSNVFGGIAVLILQ